MQHLAAGTPCPIDERPASRRKCSPCPHFISYRTWLRPGQPSFSTVGCGYGGNVLGWLRREMGAPAPRPVDPVAVVAVGIIGGLLLGSLFDRKEGRR